MRGNTSVLNDEGSKDEIKNEIKIFLELNENKDTTQQNPPEHSKNSPKKDAFYPRVSILKKKIRKSTNKWLSDLFQEFGKAKAKNWIKLTT